MTQDAKAETISETSVFKISRTFNAPVDKVWAVWTTENQLKKWFGPKGCPMKFAKLDFRVDGGFLYCLSTPIGLDMWGKWTYHDIQPMTRLVWMHTFSDAQGVEITRHPFSPTWPLQMILSIDMTPVDGNKCELTLSLYAINVTDIERTTWDSGMAGLTQGWGGTFDMLEEYLGAGSA